MYLIRTSPSTLSSYHSTFTVWDLNNVVGYITNNLFTLFSHIDVKDGFDMTPLLKASSAIWVWHSPVFVSGHFPALTIPKVMRLCTEQIVTHRTGTKLWFPSWRISRGLLLKVREPSFNWGKVHRGFLLVIHIENSNWMLTPVICVGECSPLIPLVTAAARRSSFRGLTFLRVSFHTFAAIFL